MAFTPIMGGIEAAMHMINTATGQQVVNVYHFWHPGPGGVSNTDVDDTANYLATSLWGVVRAALPSVIQLVDCQARNIEVIGGYAKTSTTNSGQPGTFGGQVAPGNSAIALSWRTPSTGRRERGRNYYGPLTATGYANDRITTGLSAALFQVGAMLIGTPPNGNLVFAVRSLRDAAMKQVTAAVLDTVVDSMRRRLLNRGR